MKGCDHTPWRGVGGELGECIYCGDQGVWSDIIKDWEFKDEFTTDSDEADKDR